ncbi:MAG: N-acetylneuraminate synthase family protein [Candidatus Margulisiibacteriota bacterium]
MNADFGPVYVIAEMACSHEGKLELAKKIIDGAGRAGASAIQFQIWSLKDMVVPHHPDFAKLQNIELSRDNWIELADYVRKQFPQMHIIACVYERSSVDFAEKIKVDAYKLHSSDLSNPFLLEYVAKTGKRIDLSVGASTMEEISAAISYIKNNSQSAIWLMYGYQNFPTPIDSLNMQLMNTIKNTFNLPVGYQDHSDAEAPLAFYLPAVALGMGMNVIEKHITHDRSFKGIDHESALNPKEFAEFTKMVREIAIAMGSSVRKPFSAEEIKYRKYSKKSLVASRDIPVGNIIGEQDLLFMRADDLGLPPDQKWRLIGKTTLLPIPKYSLMREEQVK